MEEPLSIHILHYNKQVNNNDVTLKRSISDSKIRTFSTYRSNITKTLSKSERSSFGKLQKL